MEEEAKLTCGCVPGEVSCQEAADAVRRIREVFQTCLVDGDWREFDRLRTWLTGHRSTGEPSRRTGKFAVAKVATRA